MGPNEKMEKLIAAMEKMIREYRNGTNHPVDLQRVKAAIADLEKPEPRPRREDWHYDSQGYCDNPGRGY